MKKNYLFIALTAFTLSLNATVVYTDCSDQLISMGNTINLDINNDATTDFTFMHSSNMDDMMYFGDNVITFGPYPTGGWDEIKGLYSNEVIDANTGFYSQGDAYVNPFWKGLYTFPMGADVYFGIRIIVSGKTHYGWIGVNLTPQGITIKDYAYEDVENNAISAGDKGVQTSIQAIEENTLISFFPNPCSTLLNIQSAQPVEFVKVFDITGKELLQEIGSVTQLNISSLEAGAYFISVQTAQGQTQSKIIIQ